VAKLLQGYADIELVDFNSEVRFRDGRFRLRNPLNNASYIIRASGISSNRELSLPALTTNDEIVVCSHPQVLSNKVINLADNQLTGLIGLPSSKKWGAVQCQPQATGGSTGQGLLYGFIDEPDSPSSITIDSPPAGTFWTYETTSDSNTNAGIRWGSVITRKEFNARFKAKFRVPSSTGTSNTRLYVGLSTDTTIEENDTPFPSDESGILVGWRSSDSNFQIFRNAGTPQQSANMSVTNTQQAKSTAIRSVEITYMGGGTSAVVTLYDASTMPETALYSTTFTTNLTPTGYSLAPSVVLSNSSGVNRKLDIMYVELEQSC
jgi:hypothetical protein